MNARNEKEQECIANQKMFHFVNGRAGVQDVRMIGNGGKTRSAA